MDDRRAQSIVKAFYADRQFCVWAAAYTLSYANLARGGGSPSEVIKTVQSDARARNYQMQAGILNSLASACVHHGVTWKDVGVGGNV